MDLALGSQAGDVALNKPFTNRLEMQCRKSLHCEDHECAHLGKNWKTLSWCYVNEAGDWIKSLGTEFYTEAQSAGSQTATVEIEILSPQKTGLDVAQSNSGNDKGKALTETALYTAKRRKMQYF